MDPLTRQVLSTTGGATKTYVDDVFSTHVWVGDGAAHQVVNGIDNAGEGGMVWTKCRSTTYSHLVADTVRGYNYGIFPDATGGQDGPNDNYFKSLNSDGFTTGDWVGANQSGSDFVGWNFRKASGFFDIVSYTGTGSALTVAHGLGCVPGCIIVKRLDTNGYDWTVYHKDLADTEYLILNTTGLAASGNNRFDQGDPTATHFSVGIAGDVNASGGEYIAYLFAGGESTAATARSVDFDGSGDYLLSSASSDYTFGTGDFTVEHWVKPDDISSVQQTIDQRTSSLNDGNQFCTYISGGLYHFWMNGADKITGKIRRGCWQHIAFARSSGTTTLYINGISQGTWSDSTNYSSDILAFGVHGPDLSSYSFDGSYSNLRIVKGTAVYTSSFIPPTQPLTNITNTKLLCCNNSSITGTTTGTVTSGGDPTANIHSPFDDPEGLVFGEDGDQSLIKCGVYTGDGTTTSPAINSIGWEPQWLLTKRATGSTGNWQLYDSMRGICTGENDCVLHPDMTNADNCVQDWIYSTPRGFKTITDNAVVNANTDRYIYIAIRFPDGLVGKPADAGTEVFGLTTGQGSTSRPSFVTNFPVDFNTFRKPATSGQNWQTSARLMGKRVFYTNLSNAGQAHGDYVWDSNVGVFKDADSSYQAWSWKRGAGLDVVSYLATGTAGQVYSHSLGKVPEMFWIKRRSAAAEWVVYHKGLNNGTNPWEYALYLNLNNAEATTAHFYDTAPTSTIITVGDHGYVNEVNNYYLMTLFASVAGISKVGSYTGTGVSGKAESTGFTPRFIMIKRTDSTSNWNVWDSLRGWSDGLYLNKTDDNQPIPWVNTTSTGFTLPTTNVNVNASSGKYIYYAHA